MSWLIFFAQAVSPPAPNWAIWIPVLSAFISIGGAALGSYLSAKYFSATAQSKTLLNTEKLTRYSEGLAALGAYNRYIEQIYDPSQNDFRKASSDVLGGKIRAMQRLREILSEENFVISTKGHLVIRDFFYECELEWEDDCRTMPEDEMTAYYASERAVKKAIKNFVIAGRKDMNWPRQTKIVESE